MELIVMQPLQEKLSHEEQVHFEPTTENIQNTEEVDPQGKEDLQFLVTILSTYKSLTLMLDQIMILSHFHKS